MGTWYWVNGKWNLFLIPKNLEWCAPVPIATFLPHEQDETTLANEST